MTWPSGLWSNPLSSADPTRTCRLPMRVSNNNLFPWQRVRHHLLALGPTRATWLLTVAAALLALALSQLALLVLGPLPRGLASVAVVACTLLVTPLIVWPLLRLWGEAEAARLQLDILATRDDLTGAHNRRHFLVQADREWARCRRYEMAAALLMIDVDHFKRVNDLNGHLAGDLMLREIAHAIQGTLRQADLFGRFGGEEFSIFLPHTDLLGALDAAERIRDNVARLTLDWREQSMRTTVSIGVVPLAPGHDSLGALIADADLALYAAKGAGRNCVRTPPDPHVQGREVGGNLPWYPQGGPTGPRGARTE
jgi:diguanylate cyclase